MFEGCLNPLMVHSMRKCAGLSLSMMQDIVPLYPATIGVARSFSFGTDGWTENKWALLTF